LLMPVISWSSTSVVTRRYALISSSVGRLKAFS
jgi:hypothetical protein